MLSVGGLAGPRNSAVGHPPRGAAQLGKVKGAPRVDRALFRSAWRSVPRAHCVTRRVRACAVCAPAQYLRLRGISRSTEHLVMAWTLGKRTRK